LTQAHARRSPDRSGAFNLIAAEEGRSSRLTTLNGLDHGLEPFKVLWIRGLKVRILPRQPTI